MSKPKHPGYKYRLHYLLQNLSHEDYTIAMKWFPLHLGITPKTWKSWIYIKSDTAKEIPSGAFFAMACFFDIHPRDLFEKTPAEPVTIANAFKSYKDEFLTQQFLTLL
jgi:hypothetical protein